MAKKLKSNFNKTKRWSPKSPKKRNIKVIDKSSRDKLKDKDLDIEEILEAQKKLKEDSD